MNIKEFLGLALISLLAVGICFWALVRYSDRICTHPMTEEYRQQLKC